MGSCTLTFGGLIPLWKLFLVRSSSDIFYDSMRHAREPPQFPEFNFVGRRAYTNALGSTGGGGGRHELWQYTTSERVREHARVWCDATIYRARADTCSQPQ
jgi:hypothetical protein